MPGTTQDEAAPRFEPPASPFDAHATLLHLLARLRASSGATRVSVWVHEATTELVVPFRQSTAATREPLPLHPALRTPANLCDSPFLSAVVTGRRAVVAHADGRRAEDRQLAEVGIRSGHGEPLLLDGQVVGVLTVEPAAAAAPHLLRQVAPRIAAALAEAWTRRTQQRRLDQAGVLLTLIESAAQAQSMDHLLGSACRQLAELGGVERACVFLLEDGRLVPRMAAYADGRRDLATWQQFRAAPVALELAETVLRTGTPLTADRDSDLVSGWWVDSFQVASALAVPLGRSPELAGVLTLDSTQVRPFSEDVRRLAAAAGAHLGGVIEQARTSQARAASLATARVVRQLLVDGSAVTGAAAAAEVLARAVQRLAGTDRSAAYLVDADDRIREVRHVDWPEEHKQVVQDRLVGRPASGVALWRLATEERAPVFVEDATSTDLLDPELVRALGVSSWISVPLMSGDRLLGLVVTGSVGSSRTWSPSVRDAVRQVTLEGALVVENAELRATEQERLAQLATEAHHDPLTGLPNRRKFIDTVETTVHGDRARRCALLMVDLDRFKEINDSFGHSVGDDLLCLVGPRLERTLRPGDLLARMGGDEFAVLLPDADADRAREVADGLGAALRDAFVLAGMSLHVDASIGIALCPDHGRDRSLLLARADSAMYAAKRGRRGYEVWAPDGTPATRDRLQTLEQLRSALDGEELVNHYQPQLDLRTGSVAGVEALVRWDHPDRGLLYPDVFLPLAEQAGLMRRLALRVLERSLRDLHTWRTQGHDLSVAVNLSVSNLQDVALPEQVEMLLDTCSVPASSLVLEITEDVLMADAARSQQVMAGLRRLGVRLSVDDYGTGYSSLSYLRALPVDELKLDRSFVTHLTSDPRAAAIVRSTLQLSRDLGMSMVVEGVEDADALGALREWGCDVAQGYHISRPMPAERVLGWLNARPLPAAAPRRD
ncbi:diguanylate cyclase (GGDEF) domain-containing protein [Blastococcus sp. DSM 46786]|uniref:bifunctional diguanylate cyclase/phosphodiesterase n=1 Tax=Blastococcus sp. DSM 46786 TaxID=1798227 RepID=UPI0008BC6CE8|nr:EAL domain-containing protein [Blastococcus sp. DSM 46786]SEK77861.1 diguanylate cyclase (GGDEF) domain-containing protein [Blastococcus sp. DSM 46786]